MPSLTLVALAAHLHCGTTTIRNYLAAGIIEKLPDGRYDEDVCRSRVLAHLRDLGAKRTGKGSKLMKLSDARAGLLNERRDAVAFRNAVARGEFVKVDVVQNRLLNTVIVMREKMLSMPGKIADSCVQRSQSEIEAIIRTEIDEVVAELGTPESYVYGGKSKS